MLIMKFLIFTVAFLVLIKFSGIFSFVDAHVFAWIPSFWIAQVQKAATILIGLSIIAYATLYFYCACKRTDKPSS